MSEFTQAAMSLSILLGLFVTVGGLLRIVWAFEASSLGKGLFTLALGTLTLLCGVLLIANPLIGSGVLTLLLTLYFIVDGIFEIGAGFTMKGGAWLVFSGSISIILGLMSWAQFPLSGAWAMGTLVGIKLLLVGLVMIASGSAVRTLARA